jgi:hypothetical protein
MKLLSILDRICEEHNPDIKGVVLGTELYKILVKEASEMIDNELTDIGEYRSLEIEQHETRHFFGVKMIVRTDNWKE